MKNINQSIQKLIKIQLIEKNLCLGDLKYSLKTESGHIIEKSKRPWSILEAILSDLEKEFPETPIAKLADQLSEQVNSVVFKNN